MVKFMYNILGGEVRWDVFGRYYWLTTDRENEDYKAAFMENYIVLRRLQGRWNSEWDARCLPHSHQKHLWKLVIDDLDEEKEEKKKKTQNGENLSEHLANFLNISYFCTFLVL